MPFSPVTEADSWVDELAEAIAPELDAVVTILTPGTGGVHDPETDEMTGGTAPTAVISDRAATAEIQGSPRELTSGDHWRTVSLYRWTILRQVGDPAVTSGMLLSVVNGGYNSAVTGQTMRILETWATGPVTIAIVKVE